MNEYVTRLNDKVGKCCTYIMALTKTVNFASDNKSTITNLQFWSNHYNGHKQNTTSTGCLTCKPFTWNDRHPVPIYHISRVQPLLPRDFLTMGNISTKRSLGSDPVHIQALHVNFPWMDRGADPGFLRGGKLVLCVRRIHRACACGLSLLYNQLVYTYRYFSDNKLLVIRMRYLSFISAIKLMIVFNFGYFLLLFP